jgi:hypothetical protein
MARVVAGRNFSSHFGRWVEELETVLADHFPGG